MKKNASGHRFWIMRIQIFDVRSIKKHGISKILSNRLTPPLQERRDPKQNPSARNI
jgi:hypothetical protein